jgi:hypothetical protein
MGVGQRCEGTGVGRKCACDAALSRPGAPHSMWKEVTRFVGGGWVGRDVKEASGVGVHL